jgi:NADPH:quinone reductase-like Zn-dependent oxidoreductase
MKAIFAVPGPEGGIFEYREIPVPSPAAGEVLIAIRALEPIAAN